jgi:hypothetical protein
LELPASTLRLVFWRFEPSLLDSKLCSVKNHGYFSLRKLEIGCGSFAEAEGSFAEPEGSFAEPEGSFAEPEGSFAEPEGSFEDAERRE